jgi:hypothetical protein
MHICASPPNRPPGRPIPTVIPSPRALMMFFFRKRRSRASLDCILFRYQPQLTGVGIPLLAYDTLAHVSSSSQTRYDGRRAASALAKHHEPTTTLPVALARSTALCVVL